VSVRRLAEIPGFNIDRVAAAAGDDPDVLRLENLDTDLRPPATAIEATRAALGEDDANSWLPFTGLVPLREAVADFIERRSGVRFDPGRIVITNGDGDAMLDAIYCVTDPGDEVILTDPTYAGMVNRVRLAGAVPRLAPLRIVDDEWRLDPESFRAAAGPRTSAVFILNPSFPTGMAMTAEEWEVVAEVCRRWGAWLVYWSSYEGILFDGRPIINPLTLPEMADRTVVVGSVSMEQRMIGWRVGWVAAPGELPDDLARVHIYNGLVASGFAQIGAAAALSAPAADQDADLSTAVAEWQRRRDVMLEQLAGLPVARPAGAWSLLLDVAALGLDAEDVSRRLLEQKVAATPMVGWGGRVAARHVRFVFSNEPVDRLALLGPRVAAAIRASRG
jgi:aspartate/methionine/tyrosine aminotransferase